MTAENPYASTGGMLLMKLRRTGVKDIEAMANAMHQLRRSQLNEGIFSYDFFTEHGSDANSPMCIDLDGPSKTCSLWSVNHYLGLNRHPYVSDRVIEAVREFGTGCGTSAMSGGMNTLHRKIEAKLRNWLRKDGVMLFPTGYSANLGLMSAICQADDRVLIDDESHASIRDGVRLSDARRAIPFLHNSVSDLERRLEAASRQCRGKVIVVVEGAYSMSGDLCPLADIVALKDMYDFLLVVDEAHSFGLYGESGSGLCAQEGLLDRVDFITSTFSKATASIGGFVATSAKFVSFLQWAATAYVFQACFPPADAAAILASMEVIESHPEIRAELHEKNQYMRQRLLAYGFDLGLSKSPIIPVYIPITEKLLRVCFELFKEGVFSVPLTPPGVKEHEGRIRFIVNVRHTFEQIDKTVDLLKSLAIKYGLHDDQEQLRNGTLFGQPALAASA